MLLSARIRSSFFLNFKLQDAARTIVASIRNLMLLNLHLIRAWITKKVKDLNSAKLPSPYSGKYHPPVFGAETP